MEVEPVKATRLISSLVSVSLTFLLMMPMLAFAASPDGGADPTGPLRSSGDIELTPVGDETDDTEPPVLDLQSLTISQREATVGDTITFGCRVTDDSEVSSVMLQVYHATSHRAVTIPMQLVGEGGLYQGTFSVTEGTFSNRWLPCFLVAEDSLGNQARYLDLRYADSSGTGRRANLSAWDFMVTEPYVDREAPTLDSQSLQISQTEAVTGDSVTFTCRVSDPSGVQAVSLTLSHVETSTHVRVTFSPLGEDDLWSGTLNVTDETLVGEWQPGFLLAVDQLSNRLNYVDLRSSYSVSPIRRFNLSAWDFAVVTGATSLSSCTCELSASSVEYDPLGCRPTVTVKDGETELVAGTDYRVEYANNDSVGTAQVTVRGIGSYTGTIVKEFQITPASLTEDMLVAYAGDLVYLGGAQLPELQLSYHDQALVEGTDYAAATAEPAVDAGEYELTISGANNYMGSLTKTFVIAPDAVECAHAAGVVADGELVYGQKLSELAVANAEFVAATTQDPVAGSFVFDDPDAVPEVGTHTVGWTFVPDDTQNYLSATGTLEVVVGAAGCDVVGHTWGAATVETPATCSSEGLELVRCAVCGEVQPGSERVLSKLAHTWGAWKVTRQATYDAEGLEERACSVCHAKEQRPIAKVALPAVVSGEVSPEKPVAASTVDKQITTAKNDNDPKGSTFGLLQAKGQAKSKSSIKVTWKKVAGAQEYVVYGNACGAKNKYKKITTVKGTSFTQKKLKKGTYYKYLIVAVSGDKALATSKTVHVATKGGKVGNSKSVKTVAKGGKVSLKAGKSFKLRGKEVAQFKKLKVKKHRTVAYESSNPQVATVSAKGVVKAKGKGTCYVYAYAQCGVCVRVKVTVK